MSTPFDAEWLEYDDDVRPASALSQRGPRQEALDALDVLTEYVRESAQKRRFGKTMAQRALLVVRAELEAT